MLSLFLDKHFGVAQKPPTRNSFDRKISKIKLIINNPINKKNC